MANHHGSGDAPPFEGNPLAEELRKQFLALKKTQDALVPNIRLGKQHDHPQGMYGPTDEGSLGFAIGSDQANCRVYVEFATPTAWVAMDPQQAVQFAELLIKHARVASKTPLRVTIA